MFDKPFIPFFEVGSPFFYVVPYGIFAATAILLLVVLFDRRK